MVQFPQWDRPFGSSDREETVLCLGKSSSPSLWLQEQLNVTKDSEHMLFRNEVREENTASVRKQVALI